MSTSVTLGRPGQFREFEAFARRAFEQAALRATARAARKATQEVRDGMRSAGLGRLSNAITTGSDQAKRGQAKQQSNGFSASGWIIARGRSERTRGALEAYTRGAQIVPRHGRWLAIPTEQIPQKVGGKAMTPALYRRHGLEDRLGPLEFVRGRSGNEAMLIIRDVTVDRFGRKGRRARRLPRRGAVGSSRRRVRWVVAFVLIRATSRVRRIDPEAIIARNAARVPALMREELQKEIRRG